MLRSPARQPLPRAKRRLKLPPHAALADGLARSLEGILDYAASASARVTGDPEVAVHEFRKSLRRARSLVRLARPLMSRTARRRIAAVLKEAHRATSPLRDLDVLLSMLDHHEVEGAAALRSSLLAHHRERSTRRRIGAVLARGVEAIRPLPGELARALPEKVTKKKLLRGFQATYRRARQELERSLAIPDPVHLHNWRKRTKDLSYQLELLSSAAGAELKAFRKPYAALASTLGEVTDLVVLRQALATEAPEAKDPAARARGLARLDELLGARLEVALADGRALFRKPPKKARRKVAGLLAGR